ncbi:MAG: hydroxymethylbilane synthase, partial [Pseudomonadota bacterium]
AQLASGRLNLSALVAAADGREVIRGKLEGPLAQGEVLGRRLAEELLEKGARDILNEVEQRE